jgi:hypothetical protein
MKLLMLNTKGVPINHGTIVQTITTKKYLCRFEATPVNSRIVRLKELETFHLFSNDDELNRFIEAIVKVTPPINDKENGESENG